MTLDTIYTTSGQLQTMSPKPNILLIVLDTVRARNTSLHNHYHDTTPSLCEFATGATTYRQARAPGIHSMASHASIWTGTHVEQHRCIHPEDTLKPEKTIWHTLQQHGYETGLFTPNGIVGQISDHPAIFDRTELAQLPSPRLFESGRSPKDVEGNLSPLEYVKFSLRSGSPFRSIANGLYLNYFYSAASENVDASPYIDAFFDWADDRERPWAACLNFLEAHSPYRPDPEFNRWGDERLLQLHDTMESDHFAKEFLDRGRWWLLEALEYLYDGCIRQGDESVRRVVSGLQERDQLGDTLVVITSDHGEGFGERAFLRPDVRVVNHFWGIHEVLTHVPLVVKYPGQTTGEEVQHPATLTRFPEVVRGVIRGDRTSFAADRVLTSTYRLLPQDIDFVGNRSDAERCVGPWRAAYDAGEDGETIRKYAAVGEENDPSMTLEIRDAQVHYPVISDDHGMVSEVFGDLGEVEVKKTHQPDPPEDE